MRPLTEEESKVVFTKLANYIGKNLVHLIDRPDEPYCFRLHRDRVYYVSESSMRLGISVARPNLYAKFKVWIKPNGEMPFLYGNHVLKAHLGRITEDTPEHQGVVVFAMNDVPLGFGVTARSTVDTRKLDPTAIIVFHQADVGEYLRDEETLF
ncbi:NIP7 family protein [Abortiporus biennis]